MFQVFSGSYSPLDKQANQWHGAQRAVTAVHWCGGTAAHACGHQQLRAPNPGCSCSRHKGATRSIRDRKARSKRPPHAPTWMSSALSGIFGGQPSRLTPTPPPWLSPQVLMRNRRPKLLPMPMVVVALVAPKPTPKASTSLLHRARVATNARAGALFTPPWRLILAAVLAGCCKKPRPALAVVSVRTGYPSIFVPAVPPFFIFFFARWQLQRICCLRIRASKAVNLHGTFSHP